jgi:hypothetical protein
VNIARQGATHGSNGALHNSHFVRWLLAALQFGKRQFDENCGVAYLRECTGLGSMATGKYSVTILGTLIGGNRRWHAFIGGATVLTILLLIQRFNYTSEWEQIKKYHLRNGTANATPVLHTSTPPKHVLCYSDDGAGLSDRKYVFTTLSRWAKVLDVQLNLKPPCLLLSPEHNNGQRLGCKITWSRYFDFPSGVLTNKPCSINMTDYYQLTKYVKQVEPYSTGSEVEFSNFVKEQSMLLREHMTIPLAYDMIHIRRTDTLNECDTRLSVMEKLLRRRDFATKHVVYATDETNEMYNNAILKFLRNRGLKVYFIEPEMRERFVHDNYMAYAISRVLQDRATRRHEWRRGLSCPQPESV